MSNIITKNYLVGINGSVSLETLDFPYISNSINRYKVNFNFEGVKPGTGEELVWAIAFRNAKGIFTYKADFEDGFNCIVPKGILESKGMFQVGLIALSGEYSTEEDDNGTLIKIPTGKIDYKYSTLWSLPQNILEGTSEGDLDDSHDAKTFLEEYVAVIDSLENRIEDLESITIKYTKQDLEEEQKAQARENIGINKAVTNGDGENSTVVGIGDANGDYSIAGGTNDTSLVSDIIGSLGNLGDIDPSVADGDMSIAYGAGAKAHTAGTVSVGCNTEAGCKGFYWFSFSGNTLTLSTTQTRKISIINPNPKWDNTAATALSNWKSGDKLCIVNNNKYVLDCTITNVNSAAGTVTVDKLPFTSEETVLIKAHDDFAIYVPSKPTAGVVDFALGAMSFGLENQASGSFSFSTGWNNLAAGDFSNVGGRDNVAGYAAAATGKDNEAIGHYSFTSGLDNEASGYYATAFGTGNTATGSSSTSEGIATTAQGTAAKSSGYSDNNAADVTDTSADNGSIIADWNTNKFTLAKGNYSTAEGRNALALGLGARADGYHTIASGEASHSGGRNTYAAGVQSEATGYNTVALGNYSVAKGYSDNKATDIVGSSLSASLDNSTIIADWNNSRFTLAKGNYSEARGKSTLALGLGSTADGIRTIATAEAASAHGLETQAHGNYSTSGGQKSTASGKGSVAIGENVTASGMWAQAFGSGTNAVGSYSSAEGLQTGTEGNATHAEGYGTYAKNTAAHAEGRFAVASALGAHAEGGHNSEASTKLTLVGNDGSTIYKYTSGTPKLYTATKGGVYIKSIDKNNSTIELSATLGTTNGGVFQFATHAGGTSSHAEGNFTAAMGSGAHSEGSHTQAIGQNSHAGGEGTIAKLTNQTVIGQYNEAVADSLFVVGNGTSDSARSNAFWVKSDGTTSLHKVIDDKIAAAGGGTGNFRILRSNIYLESLEPGAYLADGDDAQIMFPNETTGLLQWFDSNIITLAAGDIVTFAEYNIYNDLDRNNYRITIDSSDCSTIIELYYHHYAYEYTIENVVKRYKLPEITAADEGKTLKVVNGKFQLV